MSNRWAPKGAKVSDYTQGPWRVEITSPRTIGEEVSNTGPATARLIVSAPLEHCYADARLIAAAPEMAQLLQRLLNEAIVTAGDPVWNEARTLLARIQGEETP